jgi:hypothetical protein
MIKNERDEELEKRLHTYDGWVKEKKIPYSSKVIPVNQSLKFLQWVLPTQQALEILTQLFANDYQSARKGPFFIF